MATRLLDQNQDCQGDEDWIRFLNLYLLNPDYFNRFSAKMDDGRHWIAGLVVEVWGTGDFRRQMQSAAEPIVLYTRLRFHRPANRVLDIAL